MPAVASWPHHLPNPANYGWVFNATSACESRLWIKLESKHNRASRAPAPSGKRGKPVGIDPDAWARFERALDVVVKAKPMHRTAPKAKPQKAKKRG